MKRGPVLAITSAALVVLANPTVSAQQKPDAGAAVVTSKAPGRATVASAVKISATVESIDQQQRRLVLKGPRGNLVTMAVGPEVRNLDQIKVGDLVVARYLESLSLTLKKDGKELRSRRASKAGTPGQSALRQVEITADVIAVDPKSQTVTLRGPRHTVDLKLRDPEQFKLVKVGDQVEAVYTEALALSLEPAKAKPAMQ